MRLLFQLLAPHYVLVFLATYVYKPRLTAMVKRFNQECRERSNIVDEVKIQGINQISTLYEVNLPLLEKLLLNSCRPYQAGGFLQKEQL